MLKKIATVLIVSALPLAALATEYQIVERPRQECWNEQVPVQSARQDYGGAIIGGIAGGIIGNQVGGGNGRTVATAIGAMTGAVVGDRMSTSGPAYQMQTVQRCRTVMDRVRVPVVYEQVEIIRVPPPPPIVVEQRAYFVEQPGYYLEREEHRHRRRHWHHRYGNED